MGRRSGQVGGVGGSLVPGGSWVREQDGPESGAFSPLTTSTWGQPSPAGRMVVTMGGLAPSQLLALGSGCWCLELPRASEAVSAQASGSARLGFEFECSCPLVL